MDLSDLIASKRFLGNEFLLWLWFREDEDAAMYKVDDDHVELRFDDRLQLDAHLAEAETSVLKGGAPAHSPEAHKALQVGKRVSKARLRLFKGEREWVFNVDTGTFHITSVKTPAVLSKEDDEPFFERLYLIEELQDAWYGIYRQFLEERLAEDWESNRTTIADWIAQPVLGEAE